MFDYNVQILENNELKWINFLEYIREKMVLICPNIDTMQRPNLEYMKYLDGLLDTPKLDEIIMLNSSEDNMFHMCIKSYYPRLTTISDPTQNYINLLKNMKKTVKGEQLKTITKKWMFQQLVYDGHEMGFWEQPLHDHWTYFLKNSDAVKRIMRKGEFEKKILQKLYMERYKQKIFDVGHKNFLKVSGKDGVGLMSNLGANFFYFNLYYNENLNNMLNNR